MVMICGWKFSIFPHNASRRTTEVNQINPFLSRGRRRQTQVAFVRSFRVTKFQFSYDPVLIAHRLTNHCGCPTDGTYIWTCHENWATRDNSNSCRHPLSQFRWIDWVRQSAKCLFYFTYHHFSFRRWDSQTNANRSLWILCPRLMLSIWFGPSFYCRNSSYNIKKMAWVVKV